jgi:hypothetical protein
MKYKNIEEYKMAKEIESFIMSKYFEKIMTPDLKKELISDFKRKIDEMIKIDSSVFKDVIPEIKFMENERFVTIIFKEKNK